MNKNDKKLIEKLTEGRKLIFWSNEPNAARRSMNGDKCSIFAVVQNPSPGYPHGIALHLRFTDQIRDTYATIYEVRFRRPSGSTPR